MNDFPAAPWPMTLKATSLVGTVLLLAAAGGAMHVIPPPSAGAFTHAFGTGIACVLPLLLAGSLLFVVRGYRLGRDALYVRRLLWWTRIPLTGLHAVHGDPALLRCSKRLFGNGGLYAFTGLYSSEKLGRYRLFGTDVWHPVILQAATRTVVVTPAEPFAFIDAARRLLPAHIQAGNPSP